MKRRLALVLALVLGVGALAGCGSKPSQNYGKQDPAPAPAKSDKMVTLKIGQLPVIDGLPFWVAEKKDYYKAQGVNVELVTFRSADERDAAIAGNQVDGILSDMIGSITMFAKQSPAQITSINLGAKAEEGPFAIVAGPKSGITDLNGLKGKEVAISNNSVIQYVAESLMQENGFKPEEMKLTNIPSIPVRFETLMSGGVPAAVLPEPLLSLAVKNGGKVILNDAEAKQNYSQSVIVFSDKAIKEKSEAIKQFFIAYNRAVVDIQLSSADFKDLLVEKAKLPAEIKDAFVVKPFPPAQAPKKEDVERVVEWLLSKKLLDKPVAYDQVVNTTLVPKQQ